jgi:PAS domain S-box-containing protein
MSAAATFRRPEASGQFEDEMTGSSVAHPVVSSALDLDLLRTFLDDGPDGIVLIGADAALEFMSPGALRLFDADGLAAFAGRSFVDLWSQPDRPGVEAALAAARSGEASRVQAKGMTIQGRERHWDLVLRPLRTGTGEARRAVAVVRDVTDLLHRKAPVQADNQDGENKADRGGCVCQGSEALLRSALNTMDQGLMLIDADERVSLCNARAIELLGLPPELMAT